MKSLNKFYIERRNRDGHRGKCSECDSEHEMMRRRSLHPDAGWPKEYLEPRPPVQRDDIGAIARPLFGWPVRVDAATGQTWVELR